MNITPLERRYMLDMIYMEAEHNREKLEKIEQQSRESRQRKSGVTK